MLTAAQPPAPTQADAAADATATGQLVPTPVAAESQEAASSDLPDAAAHDALVSTALDYSIVPEEAGAAEGTGAEGGAGEVQTVTSADVRMAARAAASAAAGAARTGSLPTDAPSLGKTGVRTRRRAPAPTPSWAMGGRRRQGMGGSAGVSGLGPKGCECCGLPGHDQTWRDEMYELNYLRP